MKLKATKNQRIRVGAEKQDIKKWQIVDIPKADEYLFKTHWFIEIKMEDEVEEVIDTGVDEQPEDEKPTEEVEEAKVEEKKETKKQNKVETK